MIRLARVFARSPEKDPSGTRGRYWPHFRAAVRGRAPGVLFGGQPWRLAQGTWSEQPALGSASTRTRDLRRDRPVMALPGGAGIGGDSRRSMDFRPSPCGDWRVPAGGSGSIGRESARDAPLPVLANRSESVRDTVGAVADRPPPYHGSSEAVTACTRGPSRARLSRKSTTRDVPAVPMRVRAVRTDVPVSYS